MTWSRTPPREFRGTTWSAGSVIPGDPGPPARRGCGRRGGVPVVRATTGRVGRRVPRGGTGYAARDRLPLVASATIARAPTYVFPDPGGPWIGSTPRSSSRQSRTVASTRSSSARRSGAPIPERRRGGRRHRNSEAARYGPSPSSPAVAMWSAKASSESSRSRAGTICSWNTHTGLERSERLDTVPVYEGGSDYVGGSRRWLRGRHRRNVTSSWR